MSETVTEALRSVYAGHRQQLYTYAVSLTRNRESAEDAVSVAFQRLLGRQSLPPDLKPYVFRCVRNAALDDLRRKRVRSASIFSEDTFPDPALGDPGGPLLARELEQLLGVVSSDEREVIVLKICNSLTFQEIADLRGLPLSTVTSWYRRGLDKARAFLRKEIQ